MASPKAVTLLEKIYVKVDKQVRDILATWEPDPTDFEFLIQFDGGGLPLVAGLSGQGEIPDDGRIIGARIFLGHLDVASSATIAVYYGSYTDYPVGTLLHNTGTIPTLTSNVKASLSLDGWIHSLRQRDVLSWDLLTFTGPATHLTLGLLLRRTPVGTIRVADLAGTLIVDNSGNPVTIRS